MHVYTIFDGKPGLYYDAVGNELFIAKFLAIEFSPVLGIDVPIYQLEFDDETSTGIVKDHGYNVFLGEL